MAKFESSKEVLYNLMVKNPEMETNEILQIFMGSLTSKRSLYRWIKQVKQNGALERKNATGRPKKIAPK